MYGHHGDFYGKGREHGHGACGCHGGCHGAHHAHADGYGHGAHFGRHGWAFLSHEERVQRLVQAKESLESQLAEIQKTLSLLLPTEKSSEKASDTAPNSATDDTEN